MLDSTYIRISVMGGWGFSAKAIRRYIKKYDGEEFSVSTIYRTLQKQGIRLKAFRDCQTRHAQAVARDAGATDRPLLITQHEKKKRKRRRPKPAA